MLTLARIDVMPTDAEGMPNSTRDADAGEYPGEPLNIFFRLSIGVAVLLVITVLALIALPSGDPSAPVHHWLSRFGGLMIACEVGLCLLFSLIALASDRRKIVERAARQQEQS